MKSGKEIFEFNGHALLTSYAKYLIEYLETCRKASLDDEINLIPTMRESKGEQSDAAKD